MAQVVTNENVQEFIANGKVAPFVPPDGAIKAAAQSAASVEAAKKGSDAAVSKAAEAGQVRNTDGTFASQSGEQAPKTEKGKAAPQPAVDDDPEGANLTEHAKSVIGKKHRRMKEAEEFATTEGRRALTAESKAAALQAELDALKKSGPGQTADKGTSADADEPKPEDFKTVGEYTRALTKYEVKKAAEAAAESGKRHNRQAAEQAQVQTFAQRQQEFAKIRPDYEQVLEASELDIPSDVLSYIVESDTGPELALYLAEHPDEAARLRTLSPRLRVGALGKLEATKLSSAAAPGKPVEKAAAQPEVSKAPAPTKPLDDNISAVVAKDPSQMNFQELRAHREAERRAGKRV